MEDGGCDSEENSGLSLGQVNGTAGEWRITCVCISCSWSGQWARRPSLVGRYINYSLLSSQRRNAQRLNTELLINLSMVYECRYCRCRACLWRWNCSGRRRYNLNQLQMRREKKARWVIWEGGGRGMCVICDPGGKISPDGGDSRIPAPSERRM